MAKRQFIKNNKLKLIGLIVLSLCIMSVGIILLNYKYMNTSTISENIYIERAYVGNLTKSEAMEKVEKRYIPGSIKLTYMDKVWNVEPDQINLKYNIKNSVYNAYNYTRDKSLIKNIKKIIELHKGHKEIIKLETVYNEVRLSEIIQVISDDIDVAMKDATLSVSDGVFGSSGVFGISGVFGSSGVSGFSLTTGGLVPTDITVCFAG